MLRNRCARRGGVAIWTLLALPVAVLLLVFALVSCEVSLLAEQSRRTADACAHDATAALVGDDLLRARLGRSDPRLRPTFDAAHAEAERAARVNPIYGCAVVPDRNRNNDPCGEFVLGTVRRYQFVGRFEPVDPDCGAAPNAVRIQFDRRGRHGARMTAGVREDLVVTATAMLDDAVCGFRPTHDGCVLPVAPIALDRRVWDEEDCAQLPDIRFRLMAECDPDPRRDERPTAVPLTVGTRNVPELCRQVRHGVRADECERFERKMGRRFELDEDRGRLVVPGDRYTGHGHEPIWEALKDLRKSGDVRAWPTTVQFDPRDEHRVWVTGFVAARVIEVKEDEITYKPIPWSSHKIRVNVIDVTLRPAMLCTPTVVTRRTAPANPYLCTVRVLTAE